MQFNGFETWGIVQSWGLLGTAGSNSLGHDLWASSKQYNYSVGGLQFLHDIAAIRCTASLKE
jgi:hypothetical protein